jgi:BirA family biotin operon repressor/biotin-[acetyl-CoA-carboxylase] ligase
MKKDLTTLFTGRQVTFLPEVDSTNTYLSGLLRSITLPEGSVIRAMKQRAGRGQKNTVWESEEKKNLLVSFIFYPSFIQPMDVFILNKTFTLGVYDFVSRYLGKKVTIKWPNDIYWKNTKVSGILIENSISASSITHSILGIGININQVTFSKEVKNPGSFSLIKKKEYDLEELFQYLCSFLEARYLMLKNGNKAQIEKDYTSVLYSLDLWKKFETDSSKFKGKITGVDESGKLIVQVENGESVKFNAKEIRYVEKAKGGP